MRSHDIVILGGGLTGISCCALLQSAGADCLLLEREAELGGLTRTRQIEGFVFDCHGGHVFNTKRERVREWVFSLLPESEWHHSPRQAKILYDGKFISYPFEFALSELSAKEATECIAGMFERTGEEPETFGAWLKWNFGTAIADRYLVPYNERIWKRDLDKMSAHWVRGKMPAPDAREVLYAALSKDSSEQEMVHSSYYYPKREGIAGFTSRVTQTLGNVELTSPVESLEKERGRWIVNGSVCARRVISTVPIPELVAAMKEIPSKVADCVSRLDYNSLTTVFCEQRRGQQSSWSWLYLPGSDLTAHRIVYQGGLAPNNCPEGRFAAIYEMTSLHQPEVVIAPFQDPCLPDELRALRVLGFAHTKYAYPVFHLTYLDDIAPIQDWLSAQGITSCGRFAEWKYLNMNDCIQRAFEVRDIILGSRERGV